MSTSTTNAETNEAVDIYDKITTKRREVRTVFDLLDSIKSQVNVMRQEYQELIPQKSIIEKEIILYREANLMGKIEALEEFIPLLERLIKTTTKFQWRSTGVTK